MPNLARAANTGISGFIDPCGRIVSQTPLYEDLAPVGEVAFLDIPAFYTQWGDRPLVSSLIFLLHIVGLLHVIQMRRQRKKRRLI